MISSLFHCLLWRLSRRYRRARIRRVLEAL